MTRKKKTYLDYLKSINGKEYYFFADPKEAYNFGTQLRIILNKEKVMDDIEVDISGDVVRVKLKELCTVTD